MPDYYKVLEVDRQASREVIEKAYKTLARKYHPDHNGHQDSAAKQKMQELNEAYEILKNPKKRRVYDELSIPVLELWLNDGLIGLFKQWLHRQKINM